MAIVVKQAAMKSSRAKWLKDFDNLETIPGRNQDRSREMLGKIKLYLKLTVIRIIKLDFRFGDNRTNDTLVNQPAKIERNYVMPSQIPDPPVVLPHEWNAVQSNRSNQGLGSVRRNNEIFDTRSNPPAARR